MIDIIEPETPRLRLRQWTDSDRPAFAAMSGDREVMRYFPEVLPRRKSDRLADRCAALIAARGWGVWVVETRIKHEFVGIIGLHVPDARLPPSPCVEVLWRLARAHWGKGYASEGGAAALAVGFEAIGLSEIFSFAVVDNYRSRAVMERLGMIDTGDVFAHPEMPAGHRLSAHCAYRISRSRWSDRLAARQDSG